MTRRVEARSGDARDRGSADALGLALLAPAAIGLALVILLVGRGVDARATAQTAAESAAQAAAQERTPAAARAAAARVGAAMLVDATSCANPQLSVDTTDFRPGGMVAVTVTCAVSAVGLEPVAAGPTGAYTARAVATLDPLRRTDAGS